MSTFATRYKRAVATFGGVDYATQRFNVSQNHALDQNNFIYRDGVVQKRLGYEQVAKFDSFKIRAKNENYKEYEIQPSVRGLWKLKFKNSATGAYKDFIFGFVGCCLGLISRKDGQWTFKPFDGYSNGAYNTIKFDDLKQPCGFFGDNRFWFLGGNVYAVVSWAFPNDGSVDEFLLEEVADSDFAYVPTTTSGITYRDAKAGTRLTLEPTNLLNRFRKNELLTGVGKAESGVSANNAAQGYEYVLDAPIKWKDEQIDMDRMTLTIKTTGRVVE